MEKPTDFAVYGVKLPERTLETTNYEFIDALRGFAILAVIAVHTIEVARPESSMLLAMARSGTRGVQLFFVVSAMTLFLSLTTRSTREASPYRNFFVRRFFRIAPLFYCAIVIYPFLKGAEPSYFAPDGIKWWHYLSTFVFCNGWIPESINSVVPGGWSIAVEMCFYLLVPLLFVILTDLRRSLLFLGFTLVLRVITDHIATSYWTGQYALDQRYIVGDFTYFWLFNQLPVFAIGIVTFHLFGITGGKKSKVLGLILLAGGAALYTIVSITGMGNEFLPSHIVQSFSFSCVAIALTLYPLIGLVNSFTCWIGKLSYSIYLVHFAVIGAAGRLSRHVLATELPMRSDVLFIAAFAAFVIAAALVSEITYKVVEVPGISLGKKIINYLDLSKSGVAASVALPQGAATNNER